MSAVASLKDKLTENWRNGALGAAGAVFLGLLILILPVDALRNLSYDFPFLFPSNTTISNVVVILMDESSREALGQSPDSPWHRALHTALLEELTERRAKAVVFDVLWDEKRIESQEADERLARTIKDSPQLRPIPVVPGKAVEQLVAAIRRHSNVVVAASVEFIRQEGRPMVDDYHGPLEVIASAARGCGVVELGKSSDEKVRRHLYSERYTNLSWTVAEAVEVLPPEERLQRRWINYYGSATEIPRFSFYQVLETNGVPAEALAGKIVFVGKGRIIDSQGSRGDIYPTPVGDRPGVEIQATAFLNLQQRDWLSELTPNTEVLLLLVAGTIFGYGLTLFRPWIAAGIFLASLLVLAVVALLLVRTSHLWFPWLIVGAVQMPWALGWAVLANTRKVYREKEVLEQTLATAQLQSGGEMKTVLAPVAGERALAKTIADHELVRCIGSGAYGEVWLARNLVGIYRAFKIIHRSKFKDDLPFQREFRGLQKFMPVSATHPGLVQILHVGRDEAGAYFYYIMETGDDETTGQSIAPQTYTPKNLANELRKRRNIPVPDALALMLTLCDGLEHLHQHQLIHRDIKPSNIIFVNGVPKLADIGLVTEIAGTSGDVSWVGTDGYIPPEGPGTPAADIYSMGKVLYEITLGVDPRRWPEFPTAVIQGPGQVDLFAVNRILLKACADKRDRYQSVAEMRTDLASLQSEIQSREKTRVD